MRKKQATAQCTTCKGEGSVWLPMLEELFFFYGDDLKAAKEAGAVVKTIYRCPDYGGTGVMSLDAGIPTDAGDRGLLRNGGSHADE